MTPFPLDGGRVGDGGGGDTLDRFAHETHAPGAVNQSRRFRREMTVGERVLWAELRKLKRNIRRQAPIGRYVADFALHSAGLVIEVDGPHHDEPGQALRDIERDAWLASQGYRVLRFKTADVLRDVGVVIARIVEVLPPPPSPALPPSRGKGED